MLFSCSKKEDFFYDEDSEIRLLNGIDLSQTKVYKEADFLLNQWAFSYKVVKPNLIVFKTTNYRKNGYYFNNTIEIHTDNENQLIEVMAHEFGHHLESQRFYQIQNKQSEIFADNIAKNLIGLDKMTLYYTLFENRHVNENHPSNEKRLKYLLKTDIYVP